MCQQKRVTKINLLHLYSNQANPSYHSFLFFFFFQTNQPQTPTHALTKKRKLKKKKPKKENKKLLHVWTNPKPKACKEGTHRHSCQGLHALAHTTG